MVEVIVYRIVGGLFPIYRLGTSHLASRCLHTLTQLRTVPTTTTTTKWSFVVLELAKECQQQKKGEKQSYQEKPII